MLTCIVKVLGVVGCFVFFFVVVVVVVFVLEILFPKCRGNCQIKEFLFHMVACLTIIFLFDTLPNSILGNLQYLLCR